MLSKTDTLEQAILGQVLTAYIQEKYLKTYQKPDIVLVDIPYFSADYNHTDNLVRFGWRSRINISKFTLALSHENAHALVAQMNPSFYGYSRYDGDYLSVDEGLAQVLQNSQQH